MSSNGDRPQEQGQDDRERISSARRRARDLRIVGPETPPDRAAPVRARLTQGRTIGGRYELVRELGRGGMGVVWLARDVALDEQIALKFLPRAIAGDTEAMSELREEARVMLALTDPNIVRLRDIRFLGGSAFLVEEFMAGGGLNELVRRRQRALTISEALWALREIVPALAAAHAQGVTHRDIKPANLLLSDSVQGRLDASDVSLKVSDFGLAFTAREALSRSSGYRPSGTLQFMAPEILQGRRPTPAADVYGVAATIYALISGTAPFVGGDLAMRIVHETAPWLDSGCAPLDAAVAAGLAKDPLERPASVDAFLDAVEASQPIDVPSSGRTGNGKVFAGLAVGAAAAVALAFTPWVKPVWSSERDGDVAGATSTAALDPTRVAGLVPTGAEPTNPAPVSTSLRPNSAALESPASEPPVEEPAPGADSSGEDGDEPSAALEALLAVIEAAPNADVVIRTAESVHDMGHPGECTAASEAVVRRLRDHAELFALAPEATPPEQMAALNRYEAQLGRLPCEPSPTALPFAGAPIPATLPPSAGDLGTRWLSAIRVHTADEHACPMGDALAALRRSAAAETRQMALDALRAGDWHGYLAVVAQVERAGGGDDVEIDARHLVPSAFESSERAAWIAVIADHLAHEHDCLADASVSAALGLFWAEAIEGAFDSEHGPDELFAAFATLEGRVGARDPEVQGLIGRHVAEAGRDGRFAGRGRAVELFIAAREFLRFRQETDFEDPIRDLMRLAEEELTTVVETGSIKTIVALANDVLGAGEVPEILLPTIDGLHESMLRAIDEILAPGRRKADEARTNDHNRYSNYARAAKAFEKVTRELEGCSALESVYFDALQEQGEFALGHAYWKNETWRSQNNTRMFHGQKDLEEAIRCGDTLYESGRLTGEELHDALYLAANARVELAWHGAVLCDRHHKPRGPKRDWNIDPPLKLYYDAVRVAAEAAPLLKTLQALEPGQPRGQTARRKLDEVNTTLREVEPETEKTGRTYPR